MLMQCLYERRKKEKKKKHSAHKRRREYEIKIKGEYINMYV